jgi:hypothetical protein
MPIFVVANKAWTCIMSKSYFPRQQGLTNPSLFCWRVDGKEEIFL